ncbi:hypothetical protein Misp02_32080 [Microtetraspora sp. NBRC 16547]|nr:hypothetical protein Misp02_32080 [Microtetraspora sp. NBRC 16547]
MKRGAGAGCRGEPAGVPRPETCAREVLDMQEPAGRAPASMLGHGPAQPNTACGDPVCPQPPSVRDKPIFPGDRVEFPAGTAPADLIDPDRLRWLGLLRKHLCGVGARLVAACAPAGG